MFFLIFLGLEISAGCGQCRQLRRDGGSTDVTVVEIVGSTGPGSQGYGSA